MRPYWILFGLSLAFRLATALAFGQPGYSDAYYYSNVASSLWQGQGFREDYLWNYLSRPLPDSLLNNPSSLYWMPLTSVLIYLAYLVSGGPSFLASQIPIILLSSLLPPLTYYLCQDIFKASPELARRYGWASGLLMVFAGIYAPYFALPDNFAPYAVFSAVFLICTYKALRNSHSNSAMGWLALAGVAAGLGYLTRVDALLLLMVTVLSYGLYRFWWQQPTGITLVGLALMFVTFALTITPWLIHNSLATGQLFAGGGTKTLFWREYNDFFSYTKPLDFAYYFNLSQPSPNWGILPILGSKLNALLENLWIVGRGALYLTPLFGLGLIAGRRYRQAEFLPFALYTVLLYLAMSLAFTFPGTRGSIFHSSGGLLPFIFVLSMVGLDRFIEWLGTISRPKATRARQRSYTRLAVVAYAFVSIGFIVSLRGGWDADYRQLKQVGAWLESRNEANAIVLVPDAPAYYYVNRQPTLVFTSDSLETNLALAKRYKARYLVLPPHRTPPSLEKLLEDKGAAGFTLVATLGEVQIYRIEAP